MIGLTINDQRLEVSAGSTLIDAIRRLGIKVPTLCHHKALTPYGACRLCLVEVQEPSGSTTVQASCSYPAREGIRVQTDTERVKRARKVVAELLLARCPESEAVRSVAAECGVSTPRVVLEKTDCILCGLCVRMCRERMGRDAIGFSGRGPRKQLEPPFGRHNERCWACGACNHICPVDKDVRSEAGVQIPKPIPNEYNLGLDSRPAVHVLYPQAVPNKPAIDPQSCLHLQHDVCGICETVCEAGAINYSQAEQRITLPVGAVVVAPGFETFDPRLKKELGYGSSRNVVTAIEFERLLSASGPHSGHVRRPSDGKVPQRIAFLQCVGSRDQERDYCSSVCCMYATKEAIIAKEHIGDDLRCDIYYMDVRAFGKGFENYYRLALQRGVEYIRCRVPRVEEVSGTGDLLVTYAADGDRKASREYDMVVLSVGMTPPASVRDLSQKLGVRLGEASFCSTSVFRPAESSREGVYVAGPWTEPKDIPETVMQGSAAAAKVLALLGKARGSLIVPQEYPPEREVRDEEPRVGIFVCHCGTNIGGIVNVPEVTAYARSLPGVVYAEDNLYTCSNDTQERIREKVKEHRLNRVVVASCTPRTHEALFRNTVREAGLNSYLLEMANIRDQCSWVHMYEAGKATRKAKDLVRMALAKARLLEPLDKGTVSVTKGALVIGGGPAGMTAALEIASQGFEVLLVEKEKDLGGNLRRVRYLLNGENPRHELERMIERVRSDERIHVCTQARIRSISGSIGNFSTEIEADGSSRGFEHGVTIVATGGRSFVPADHLYGVDGSVLTQLELEERIASNGKFDAGCVVMIQCVGSRDEERPYCSRICCSQAVKNALRIKSESPSTAVYILYRDMRTYGLREGYYTRARRAGVGFIRYVETEKPVVTRNGGRLLVQVVDDVLKVPVEIPADMVVLSAGVVAAEDNREVGQLLKVPVAQDGFFLEAHMKLRPVDFATEGVFLCGLAHAPKSLDESILQAQAAAARASTILARDKIELEANICTVIDDNCDGCAYCVEPCPYKAVTLLEYAWEGAVKKVVEVNESICKGCGTCMATCPKAGAYVKGFSLDQIGAQVDAVFETA